MRAEDAKKAMLDESVKLIAEQGLAGLSFREMARRSGLSHQAPYHHFANRAGILAAIALEGFSRLDLKLREAEGLSPPGAPRDGLRQTLKAYMSFAIENPVYFRIMFRPELVDMARYPDVRDLAMSTFDRLVKAVTACRPRLSAAKRTDISNVLWAAAHGVATLWLDGPIAAKSPTTSIDTLIDLGSLMFAEAGATTRLAET